MAEKICLYFTRGHCGKTVQQLRELVKNYCFKIEVQESQTETKLKDALAENKKLRERNKQMLVSINEDGDRFIALMRENKRLKDNLQYYDQIIYGLDEINERLKEIAQLALDMHTRSYEHMQATYGMVGTLAEKALCHKIEKVLEKK